MSVELSFLHIVVLYCLLVEVTIILVPLHLADNLSLTWRCDAFYAIVSSISIIQYMKCVLKLPRVA